jgi:hypothetical protein
MWVRRARLSGTYLAMYQMKEGLTAAFPLVRGLSVLVGDTGFEPVTSWRGCWFRVAFRASVNVMGHVPISSSNRCDFVRQLIPAACAAARQPSRHARPENCLSAPYGQASISLPASVGVSALEPARPIKRCSARLGGIHSLFANYVAAVLS